MVSALNEGDDDAPAVVFDALDDPQWISGSAILVSAMVIVLGATTDHRLRQAVEPRYRARRQQCDLHRVVRTARAIGRDGPRTV
jgi:hypothetical protein